MRKLIYGAVLTIGLIGAAFSAGISGTAANGECPPCPACPGMPEKTPATVQHETEDACCVIADASCPNRHK